jgi:hypothetical protein
MAPGYSSDAGSVRHAHSKAHPFGYVVLSGWIAREFGLQVGDTLPALPPESVPLSVLYPAPGGDVARWYFRVGNQFLVYTHHLLGMDNIFGTLVDSAGNQVKSLQFWDATFCGPATPAAGSPCGADLWPEGPNVVDSRGDTDEEDVVRARFAPPGFNLEDRQEYQQWFARASFSRGRGFCYVHHPQLPEPYPFECGLLTVGLVADSARRAPLLKTLRQLRVDADGPFFAGTREVLIVYVPLGTEQKAINAILQTDGVRYVEPFWQDTMDARRP